MAEIARIAVIGSGVMGGGIAAQAANAGVSVVLLDQTRDIAAAALDRLGKLAPPAFMLPEARQLIRTGSIGDDLGLLADCDWIVEAIVEHAPVKRELYARIDRHRRPDAAVSSNTSTIPLADLMRDASPGLRRNFLVTHFFNPPRYMRLLEIVAGPDTLPATVAAIADFADRRLGKTIVHCKDRPGFIANRLGCFWMQCAISEAIAQGLRVEDADAVMGRPFGIPKTGVFGLADLVGVDLMPRVNASLAAALEPDDLFHRVNSPVPVVDRMIAEGLTGRKSQGGFYRLNRSAGNRKEALDLATLEYRPAVRIVADDAGALLADKGKLGRYGRSVIAKTLAYAAVMVGDATDDVDAIDTAMRLGYNWKMGPFELIDRIGAETVETMIRDAGFPVPALLGGRQFYRGGDVLHRDGRYGPIATPSGILRLSLIKHDAAAVQAGPGASLWDLGEGVFCFESTTKMNTFDGDVFDRLDAALEHVEARGVAMIIYSDAPDFSAGVNLNWLVAQSNLEDVVRRGQAAFKRLKYAKVPTVAAVAGRALGGGCELMMQCSAVQAHAECYAGLVEASVGILPAWGGCGELLARLFADRRLPKGPMPAVTRAFELIATARVSASAAEARQLGFLRDSDGITMNRDRLLADAKARALQLAKHYLPPDPPNFALPGPSGHVALMLAAQAQAQLGRATPHDLRVASGIATVLTGGAADVTRPISEQDLLDLECAEVSKLARSAGTEARIRHMLDTRKPLRN